MRRLLALSVLAAALGAVAPAASANVVCEPLSTDAGVCYQTSDCPRCAPHVIVDPYCEDHHQTIWCRTIDGGYLDSDAIKGAVGG
jgi:opacity protein-like surface antigen